MRSRFWPWCWVLLCGSPLTVFPGCSDGSGSEQAAAPGKVKMALGAQGSRGNRYRLRSAEFDIAGPSPQVLSSEDFLTEELLEVVLPIGSYSITLGGMWFLEREDGMSYSPVDDALLVSANSVGFTIEDRGTTGVSFFFSVGGEVVEFGNGVLVVDIGVDEPGSAGAGGQPGGVAGAGGEGQTPEGGAGGGGAPGMDTAGAGGEAGAGQETSCGDGVLDAGEACDDGNQDPCDGCVACAEVDPPVGGATVASELISEDTLWCAGNSPVSVLSNVVVLQGATLYVGPGVLVEASDGQGLQIRGDLEVHGSAADPAVFTSSLATPVRGSWYGIVAVGEEQLVIEHAVIEYAVSGLLVSGGPDALIRDSLLRQNLVALQGVREVVRSRIMENGQGVRGNVIVVDDSEFSNNDGTALGRVEANGRILRSSFEGNARGVATARGSVQDSTFEGNGVGILETYGGVDQSTFVANNVGIDYHEGLVSRCLFTDNVTPIGSSYGDVSESTFLRNREPIRVGGASLHETTLCNDGPLELRSETINVVDATSNWWCTTESSVVSSRIWDVFDNINLGPVLYTPLIDGPPAGAPADPGPPAEGPPCGNGVVQGSFADEECDDGNLDETDACTNACQWAYCGDGRVWAGRETCDDMGAPGGCDNDCDPISGAGGAGGAGGEAGSAGAPDAGGEGGGP